MAYETGTATTPGNLLVKLFDFAGANGWTIDDDIASDAKASGWGSFHKNNIYVMFTFTTSLIHLYPARGFTADTTSPGDHPNSAIVNSGTSTTAGIHAAGMTGPISAYHFFEDDNYIHVVVSLDGDYHRHFGFGESIKAGNWTGGEYFYGHQWYPDGHASADAPSTAGNIGPFNASGGVTNTGGMWVYGTQVGGTELPGSNGVGSKWGYVTQQSVTGNDPDGDAYNAFLNLSNIKGGITGPIIGVGVGTHNGFVPLLPMNYAIRDYSTSPDNIYMLGTYPDVRACNMRALTVEGEYTIGTDTWVTFPVTRLDYVDATTQWSDKYGIAYKKVTT